MPIFINTTIDNRLRGKCPYHLDAVRINRPWSVSLCPSISPTMCVSLHSRGSEDSINVHPIEFCLGHLNSIITLFLVCRLMRFHIVGSNLLQLIYAATSCFNHSRHDITISVMGLQLWTSKDHDVHHRIPNKNFGRVIMLWDWLFGTFR
jgi:hypothetical protein